MNRNQMIKQLAVKMNCDKATAANMMNAYEELIIGSLANGDRVQLTGFGTFDTKIRKARNVRNPASGEMMVIEETTVIDFRPGKRIIDALEK